MRRTKDLENVLYKQKYKDIYKIIFTADLEDVSDFSNWYKQNPGYVEKNRPLWIICESKLIGKRIWITEDFGTKEITTADLDLDTNSLAYSKSHKHVPCKSQKEMSDYLKELLKPCLEKNTPKELREGIYEIIPINSKGEYLNYDTNTGNVVSAEKLHTQLPPLTDIVNVEIYEEGIEKAIAYRLERQKEDTSELDAFIKSHENSVLSVKQKEDVFGTEAFTKFKERFSYLYEKGVKNLDDRKYIIKICKDCFGGVAFFGYELDIQTNKYKQYTDGMDDLFELVEEHPQFKNYYQKHCEKLLKEYEKMEAEEDEEEIE